MNSADWIALQVRVDERIRQARADNRPEDAEAMHALRVFAYAQWDANKQAITRLKSAPAMESER